MDIAATHQETGAFWNEIADWYGERDEAAAIAFLRSGGSYLFPPERDPSFQRLDTRRIIVGWPVDESADWILGAMLGGPSLRSSCPTMLHRSVSI